MSLNSLDPSPEEFQRMGAAALDAMVNYLSAIRDRRVYPRTTAQEIRGKLESELPNEPVELERLLETFTELVLPFSRHNAHPHVSVMCSRPDRHRGDCGFYLASNLNANLTAWRSAPAAVELSA